MKNSFIKVGSVLIASIFFFAACSKENEPIENSATNEDLIISLKNYNEQNRKYTPKCDGFWDCATRIVAVAGSDVMGAVGGAVAVKEAAISLNLVSGGTVGTGVLIGGAVVGGATGSAVAYQALPKAEKEAKETKSILPTNPKDIIIPGGYSDFKDVGNNHNYLLFISYKGIEGTDIDSLLVDDYIVDRKVDAITSKALKSSEFKVKQNLMEQFSQRYTASGFDFESLTSEYLKASLITSDQKQVLDLFITAVKNGGEERLNSTIEYYISTVDKSSLSTFEKQSLISGFLVMSQSYYYWKN